MTPVSPISAFGSIQPISDTFSTGAAGGVGGAQGATGGINFSDALAKVQDSLDSADQLSQQLATGQLTDVHDFTVAANKAQLAVQLTVQLRNQALSAFQEIMRMQI
jgi:flagellar hook-basal body complex protein FliE